MSNVSFTVSNFVRSLDVHCTAELPAAQWKPPTTVITTLFTIGRNVECMGVSLVFSELKTQYEF